MYYNQMKEEKRKKEEFLRIVNKKCNYVPVWKQVYSVNREIFRLRALCRKNKVKLEDCRKFNEIMEEATKRYTMHGYYYDGNSFKKKKENESVFNFSK